MTLAVLMACGMGSIHAQQAESTVWCGNPIIHSHYSADPAPVVIGDTLYIYYDQDIGVTPSGSVYYYMNDWRVASSTDMVNWTDHGKALPLSKFKWANDGSAWASQCVERNDKYYWYVCADYPGHWNAIGVAFSDTPTGPFRAVGTTPFISTGKMGDIDPTVFIDDDGQAYLYWGNNKLCYVKLGKNMVSYDKAIGTNGVVEVTLTPEGFGGLKKDGKVEGENCMEEGPWLMKREGIYYLLYAAGGVPENIAYSTSDSPTGPWTYRGKIMPVTNTASFTNHCGVVEFKGKWYFVYHTGWLNEGNGGGGFNRSIAIEELHFNADGTIQQIAPTRKGVAAIGTLNPYQPVSAATMNGSSMLTILGDEKQGVYVSDLAVKDSIAVANVQFGETAPRSISLDVASEVDGCKVLVRVDHAVRGTRMALVDIPNTGSKTAFQTVTTDLQADVTGVHRVIFLFMGKSGASFKRWRLNMEDTETLTPVEQVRAAVVDDDAYYTLDGIRHSHPVRGINLHQGKKIYQK